MWSDRMTVLRYGVCRVCGCTEARACNPPCAWADWKHTLCTTCQRKAREKNAAKAAA